MSLNASQNESGVSHWKGHDLNTSDQRVMCDAKADTVKYAGSQRSPASYTNQHTRSEITPLKHRFCGHYLVDINWMHVNSQVSRPIRCDSNNSHLWSKMGMTRAQGHWCCHTGPLGLCRGQLASRTSDQ